MRDHFWVACRQQNVATCRKERMFLQVCSLFHLFLSEDKVLLGRSQRSSGGMSLKSLHLCAGEAVRLA